MAGPDDPETTVVVDRGLPFREITDRTLELDVYRPRATGSAADCDSSGEADATATRPVVVFVYGGGWTNGATGQFARYALDFAGAGWVTIECSYRLADEARFPAPIVDVHAALDWLGEHASEYGGDPDRIGLVGHSAGAHLAALASLTRDHRRLTPEASRRPEPPPAVGAVAGISGVYDFECSSESREDFVDLLGDPDAEQSLETQRRLASPVAHVGDADSIPPTLLCHGGDDEVVPAAQSEHYRDVLEAGGARVDCDVVDGADHVFLHSSGDYPATRDRVREFLEAHV